MESTNLWNSGEMRDSPLLESGWRGHQRAAPANSNCKLHISKVRITESDSSSVTGDS
jgi:hypothetical protein